MQIQASARRLGVVGAAVLGITACGMEVPPGDSLDGGDGGPRLAELPAAIDLGSGDCGRTTRAAFQLANRGDAELRYELSTSDPRLVVSPAAGALAPGATATVQLTAHVPAEADAGERLSAMVLAATNAGPTHAIPVTLRARGAQIALETSSIGFGQTPVGFRTARSFVVRNVGDAPATVTIAAPAGELSLDFDGDGAAVLSPGTAVSGRAGYLPTQLGPDVATAAVTVEGAVCGPVPRELALSGEGVAGEGVMVQGGPVDFGAVACDEGGATRSIQLVNPAAIPVPFSAGLLADAELDHLRFAVSPASGSIPAGGTVELRVRRLPLAAPADPRVREAVLRIATTLGVETVTDVPIREDVRSPLLEVSTPERDFGFVPSGQSRRLLLFVKNTGNAIASLRATAAAPFEVSLPMPLAPGATGVAYVTYKPTAATQGPVSQAIEVSAVRSCQAPVAPPFAAGLGPYARPSSFTFVVRTDCPAPPPYVSMSLLIDNLGNEPLHIRCSPGPALDLEVQLPDEVLSVPPGGTRFFVGSFSTTPSVPGASGFAEIWCTPNKGARVAALVQRLHEESDLPCP